MPERTLVTGALGCLGAWTVKVLLDQGEEPVGYDLGGEDARLRLVLSDDELARLTLVRGDVTDAGSLPDRAAGTGCRETQQPTAGVAGIGQHDGRETHGVSSECPA